MQLQDVGEQLQISQDQCYKLDQLYAQLKRETAQKFERQKEDYDIMSQRIQKDLTAETERLRHRLEQG